MKTTFQLSIRVRYPSWFRYCFRIKRILNSIIVYSSWVNGTCTILSDSAVLHNNIGIDDWLDRLPNQVVTFQQTLRYSIVSTVFTRYNSRLDLQQPTIERETLEIASLYHTIVGEYFLFLYLYLRKKRISYSLLILITISHR